MPATTWHDAHTRVNESSPNVLFRGDRHGSGEGAGELAAVAAEADHAVWPHACGAV